MKSKDLFKGLNDIDDNLIEEAADFDLKNKKKIRFFTGINIFKTAGIAAAVFVVVFAAGWGINRLSFERNIVDTTPFNTSHAIGENEMFMWHVLELVCFEGNWYMHFKDSENKNYVKGELLGYVEDSEKYGVSIYKGCPIYRPEGCKGSMKIIVESENKPLLFRLCEFEEDITDIAAEFKLYGIESAEDIKSIKLRYDGSDGTYRKDNYIEDRKQINRLYELLSELVFDKEGYDEILDRIAKADWDAWIAAGNSLESQTNPDGSIYVPGYQGTSAFDNNVMITLFTGDSEELVLVYCPKMGYVDNYKATKELIEWIGENM